LKQKYFSEKREQRRHVLTLLKRFVYYWPALLPFFSFRQRKCKYEKNRRRRRKNISLFISLALEIKNKYKK
jgi:hypothetical protein